MKSDKRLSAASMHIVLSRDYGTTISSGRVYRLMKSMDLPKMSTAKPKFRYHKPTVSLDYPNILNQQFDPNEPNCAWVSDITYIPVDTLDTALNHRQPKESVLFHSDRGSQYTSVAFRQFLDTHNLIDSYSKPGYPYDNAEIESFFKYLNRDELNRRNFHFLEQVSLAIFSYIEERYNNKRPHSHNKMLTPNEKEEQFYQL